MSDSYEIFPKFPTGAYASMFRAKVELNCTLCSEVNFDEDLHKDQNLVVPEGSALFYVEDSQFYSASKIFKTPLSAWIRLHFITSDARSLWYTLVCEPPRVWDFLTWPRRKKLILDAMERDFELLLSGADEIEELEQLAESIVAEEQAASKEKEKEQDV